MKLKAIDLSKDLPVEILHTLLLGMTKYCFIIAKDHFLSEQQTDTLSKAVPFSQLNSITFCSFHFSIVCWKRFQDSGAVASFTSRTDKT
jgi:hypothetical protein